MFHSSTSFSMDLGCPLLRGSSVRRLRRRAATTFLSYISLTSFIQTLVEKKCNSCKIIAKTFARCLNLVKFLQKNTPFSQNVLQELYSVWTNLVHNSCFCHRTKSIRCSSNTRVFLYKNVEIIKQFTKNKSFRVASENNKNDLIHKDEMK